MPQDVVHKYDSYRVGYYTVCGLQLLHYRSDFSVKRRKYVYDWKHVTCPDCLKSDKYRPVKEPV